MALRSRDHPSNTEASREKFTLQSADAERVDRLERQVAALTQQVAEHGRTIAVLQARARRRQSRRPTSDAVLASAIALAVRGSAFGVGELIAHAVVDADLHSALGPTTPQRLGKRLQALAGRPINGVVLQRVGRDARGVIWSMQVVADLHSPAGFDDGVGA